MEIVKEKFIPVAVDARFEARRKDATGQWVRKFRCVTFTAAGRLAAFTADGRHLGDLWYGNIPGRNEHLRMQSMRRVIEKWRKLPAPVRSPGVVRDATATRNGTSVHPHQVPPGALVVRTYNRQLEPDGNGGLRYTEPADYPTAPKDHRRSAARYREAAQDFMWIPEAEWRAMIPSRPSQGESFDAPRSFQARLFRFHLDPCRGLGEGLTFQRASADDGSVTITVERVTPRSVRLRIEGRARLDNGTTTYAPCLLGYLTYDRKAKEVVRFRMVALGLVDNTPYGVRTGKRLLGIAYEYVPAPRPTERTPPRGARDDLDGYLAATRS